MTATIEPLAQHPAKFSAPILLVLRGMVRREAETLGRPPRLLDPFGGTGGIHQLEDVARTTAVELRPRWAACHPRTICGDATRLHWRWTGRFDVVATSPCYGNRFADHHRAKDDSVRHSYHHDYGDPDWTHPNDAGVEHFGDAYKDLHLRAWRQVRRVLRPAGDGDPGGLLLLNVSNHIRKGQEVDVVGWHHEALVALGFGFSGSVPIDTQRMGFGENRDARAAHEVVLAFRAPVAGSWDRRNR